MVHFSRHTYFNANAHRQARVTLCDELWKEIEAEKAKHNASYTYIVSVLVAEALEARKKEAA